jgi:hypothetical protein
MISLKMSNDCIVDFDNLLKKSYHELGIYTFDNSLNHAYLVTIANNFSSYFVDFKTSNPYIIVLKTIAYHFQSNRILMTADKIYDFFITTYNFLSSFIGKIEDNRSNSKSSMADNIIFEICNDILSNYALYEDLVKIQIPNLIVDIITILFFKADPYGKKVSMFQTKLYYLSKKEELMKKNYSYPSEISNYSLQLVHEMDGSKNHYAQEERVPSKEIKNFLFNSNSDVIFNYKQFNDDEMIFRLTQITKRDNTSIKRSLSTLTEKDIKKLSDLCNNYNKVIKYSKFDNMKDFKLEIENELQRSLSEKQIRHSHKSIKKVQFYIENILDSKFEPHLTHGINHVKHNFEYGYRLVGLLGNSKAKS